MVTLEVFGLSGNKAAKMELKIFGQFGGEKYVKDIVVVINNSTARDVHAITQPFIRVCGHSSNVSVSEIMEKLAPLGLRLQLVALSRLDQ